MHLDVLAFGAHPDDVELTCAGTLIKLSRQGYKTGVVALTRGEMSSRGSVENRTLEFENAARLMGVSAFRQLDLPDGYLENNREQREKVIREIRRLKPRLVMAPFWEDRHPDHAHASRIVSDAAFLAGLAKIETGQDAHRPLRVLFYPSRFEFKPSFVVDVSEVHEEKLAAIRAYRSQFHHEEKSEFGSVETNISHPGFLEAVVTRARQYGSYIGTEFGEPFLVREPMRMDDPVAFFGDGYAKAFV